MRQALTVFVSWGKLRQPRFPKEKRAVCRLGLCMQEVFRRAYTAALCSAGRDETWGGGVPCGSMGNGEEARVLGVLKAILAFL